MKISLALSGAWAKNQSSMARAAAVPAVALLPGETSDGTLRTARRWLAAYDELLRFVERALSEPSSDEALRASLLRKRRDFRRRLVYWEGEVRLARMEHSTLL